jgi:hypothetical protein
MGVWHPSAVSASASAGQWQQRPVHSLTTRAAQWAATPEAAVAAAARHIQLVWRVARLLQRHQRPRKRCVFNNVAVCAASPLSTCSRRAMAAVPPWHTSPGAAHVTVIFTCVPTHTQFKCTVQRRAFHNCDLNCVLQQPPAHTSTAAALHRRRTTTSDHRNWTKTSTSLPCETI